MLIVIIFKIVILSTGKASKQTVVSHFKSNAAYAVDSLIVLDKSFNFYIH